MAVWDLQCEATTLQSLYEIYSAELAHFRVCMGSTVSLYVIYHTSESVGDLQCGATTLQSLYEIYSAELPHFRVFASCAV